MKLPIFARGSTEKIALAIEKSILTYPAYVMNTDTNMYGFLDDQGTITYFQGNNKALVMRVDALPEEGDTDVLYLLGTTLYSFDGENYVPTYRDLALTVDTLTDRVDLLETDTVSMDTRIQDAVARIGQNETDIGALQNEVEVHTNTLAEVANELYTMGNTVNGFGDRLTADEARLDGIDTSMQSMGSRIDTVETNLATTNESVTGLQQRVTTAEGNISSVNTSLSSLSSTVDNHTAELASHSTLLSQMDGDIHGIQQTIDEMETTGGTIVIEDGSGTPETVTVVQYIDSAKADTKQYVDEQIQLHII